MEEIIKSVIIYTGLAVVSFALYMVIRDPKIEKKGHK